MRHDVLANSYNARIPLPVCLPTPLHVTRVDATVPRMGRHRSHVPEIQLGEGTRREKNFESSRNVTTSELGDKDAALNMKLNSA